MTFISVRGLGIVAGAALTTSVALTGCSVSVGGATVNTDKAEEQIMTGIKDQTGQETKVTCPDNIEPQAGGQFACTAEFPDGKTGTVMVMQKDDKGNLSWELENSGKTTDDAPQLNTAAVEESVRAGLAEQLQINADVECPSNVPIEAGNTFECTATYDDNKTGKIEVTQTDDQGNVTWQTVGSESEAPK